MKPIPGIRAATVLVVIMVAAGCGGSRAPDLEPPTMAIVELIFTGEDSSAHLRLDNPVAAPMPAQQLSFELRVDGQRIGEFDRSLNLTIPPLGSESVHIQFATPQRVAAALSGQTPNRLEYRIEGRVLLDSGSTLRFEDEGLLFPTPGKPGSWR